MFYDALSGVPGLPYDHKLANSLCSLFRPMQPFCFSPAVQSLINYMRYLTPYYKTGFVLADFAQL